MPILLHGEWKKRDLTQLHLWDGWFVVIKWFVMICVHVSCRWSIGGWLVISLVKLHYTQHKDGFGSRMSAWVFLWSELVQSLMSVSFDVPEKTATFTLYCWWAAAFILCADPSFTFLKTRSMGHPELMSTKSTSVLVLMSSAHLVIVSGKQPSICRGNMDFRMEALIDV